MNNHVWIWGEINDKDGALHFHRAVALAEAAKYEGITNLTLVTNRDAEASLPDTGFEDVTVTFTSGSREKDIENLLAVARPHISPQHDTRKPKPVVILCGEELNDSCSKPLKMAGVEVVSIAHHATSSFADWCVLPEVNGGEVDVKSGHGRTFYLRGSHYLPIRTASMRAINSGRDHSTFAQQLTIDLENLDWKSWLLKIGSMLEEIAKDAPEGSNWKPELTLLQGKDEISAEEASSIFGGKLTVNIASSKTDSHNVLSSSDIHFAAHTTSLHEALAIGIPIISLPSLNDQTQDIRRHLLEREVSLDIDVENGSTVLSRFIFDAAARLARRRIGQYLCDGMGSLRIIRQTVFKSYMVPQNLARFFELGDPELESI